MRISICAKPQRGLLCAIGKVSWYWSQAARGRCKARSWLSYLWRPESPLEASRRSGSRHRTGPSRLVVSEISSPPLVWSSPPRRSLAGIACLVSRPSRWRSFWSSACFLSSRISVKKSRVPLDLMRAHCVDLVMGAEGSRGGLRGAIV